MTNPVFFTRIVREFEQWYLVTEPAMPQPDGALFGLTGQQYGESVKVTRLADFQLRARVGHETSHPSDETVWGFSAEFRPLAVDDPDVARSMAAVLVKVRKGLNAISESAGPLRNGDFASYVFRVGSALGVTDHYWLQSRERFNATGKQYRKTSLGALTYEIDRAITGVYAR